MAEDICAERHEHRLIVDLSARQKQVEIDVACGLPGVFWRMLCLFNLPVTGVSPVSSSGLFRYVDPAAISVAVAFVGAIRVMSIKDDRVATKSVFVDSQSNLRRQFVQEG